MWFIVYHFSSSMSIYFVVLLWSPSSLLRWAGVGMRLVSKASGTNWLPSIVRIVRIVSLLDAKGTNEFTCSWYLVDDLPQINNNYTYEYP